jgi:hypothetical protein
MLEPILIDPNASILSLEEACQPLHSFVEHLASAIKFSLENVENHTRELSIDESASIYLFILKWPQSLTNFSTVLNETLQNPNRHLLKPWLPYLNLFLTALHKLPDFNGTVWYYAKQGTSVFYKDDEKHVWWGAVLCTSSLTSLNSESDDLGTVFSIEISQGKYVGHYSYFKTNEDV